MNKMGAQLRASWLGMKLTVWILLAIIALSTVANFTINTIFESSAQQDAQDLAAAVGELRKLTGNADLELNLPSDTENVNVSSANLLLALLPLLAIILPLKTFRTMMNFGDSRRRYFIGLIMIYIGAALILALINSVWWPLEQNVIREYSQTYNVIEVFGWDQFGVAGIFVYQVAFYLFVVTLFNLLFSSFKSPITWILWVLWITAVAVGTSIASLRVHVADFFLALAFNDSLWNGVLMNVGLSLVCVAGSWLLTRHRKF